MKFLALISAFCAMAVLTACGGSSSEKTDTAVTVSESTGLKSAPSATAKRPKPLVEVPDEPPPAHLVVNDQLEGTRTVAESGDVLSVHEVGVMYETGDELESVWEGAPFTFELGTGQVIEGWDRGLVGMRAGGRRELIIPSRLAWNKGAMIYVVDLLAVKKTPPLQSQ